MSLLVSKVTETNVGILMKMPLLINEGFSGSMRLETFRKLETQPIGITLLQITLGRKGDILIAYRVTGIMFSPIIHWVHVE